MLRQDRASPVDVSSGNTSVCTCSRSSTPLSLNSDDGPTFSELAFSLSSAIYAESSCGSYGESEGDESYHGRPPLSGHGSYALYDDDYDDPRSYRGSSGYWSGTGDDIEDE
eukprot:4504493-Amphidinium_carterae.1